MLFRKKIVKTLFLLFAVLLCAFSYSPITASAETNSLYLGGFSAGFTLNTTTVEVIGICDVITSDGMRSPARDCGIKTGDIIEKINGIEVKGTKDINKILAEDYKKYTVTVIRGGESIKMDIEPAVDLSSGTKRLGTLVKDSISGVGTVTYIDKANNKFASLGHPVTDLKNNFIEIQGGTVYGCIIYDVKKGVKGTPGELRGAFESRTVIGNASINCACGIYAGYGGTGGGCGIYGRRGVLQGGWENQPRQVQAGMQNARGNWKSVHRADYPGGLHKRLGNGRDYRDFVLWGR